MSVPTQTGPVIAVFASDRGPGDPERASLMTECGLMLARKGAHIVCLAENGVVPVPLITAARSAHGHVEVIADATIAMPPALADVPVTVLSSAEERHARLTAAASVFVALPGSLASATALFRAWSTGAGRPVVMLNRNRAFEAIRGFTTDVLAASVPGYDRNIQFADNVDDLWNKVIWLTQNGQ